MELFLFIGFVILIILLSGIISGSEAALLSISYPKAKELVRQKDEEKQYNSKAHDLLFVKENMEKYITTIVVLNNVVNIVGSVYVGVLATKLFGEVYLGFVSAGLTFLIILFSEILPKVYGEKHSDTIALLIIKPLVFLTLLLSPIVYTLERFTKIMIKKDNNSQVSEGEIKEMAMLGMQEGSINSYESEVIERVFKMNDVEVYDLMVPKNKVRTISTSSTFNQIITLIRETGFTRFPVEDDNNEIIGIINSKDLFIFYDKNERKFDLKDIIRPIIYAPETMKASTLEAKLKNNKIHMAIIVNEHGDFTGIVTLEDIIEEVLGEIEDEFDFDENDEIKKINEKKYHIDASIDIEDLNEYFNLNLEEDESYSTLNGYLIAKLDKIPKLKDTYTIDEGIFRVIKRTRRKVLLVEFVHNNSN